MRFALGVSFTVFAAGLAAGYVARKRGIPAEEAPRYIVKRVVRRILHVVDRVRPRGGP